MEVIVERDVLGGEVCHGGRGLAENAGCGSGEAVQIKVVDVARADGNRDRSGGAAGVEIGDLHEAGEVH
jgi:hypothetical protein